MLEFILNPSWVLGFRSDILTSFFLLFPFLASNYFYISCIALGYWRNYNRIWISLAFLIPSVTIINWILKYLFRIDRPEYVLHLIDIKDTYGFPSSDVMVAYIFWMSLFYEVRYLYQKIFCILFLGLISASGIYLGVHSLFDVLGALAFGWFIFDVWQRLDFYNPDFLKEKIYRFWFIPFYLGALYILVAGPYEIESELICSLGALIGFAMSLPFLKSNLPLEEVNSYVKTIPAFILLILAMVFYPKIHFSVEYFRHAYCALKFSLIVFSIFVIIPFILKKLR